MANYRKAKRLNRELEVLTGKEEKDYIEKLTRSLLSIQNSGKIDVQTKGKKTLITAFPREHRDNDPPEK